MLSFEWRELEVLCNRLNDLRHRYAAAHRAKHAGLIDGVVQVVLPAAFFSATRADEGAELGFEQEMLPFFGAKDHDQRQRFLRQSCNFHAARLALAGAPLGSLLHFSFGHNGRDCISIAHNGKKNPQPYFSGVFFPALRLSKFSTVFSTSE